VLARSARPQFRRRLLITSDYYSWADVADTHSRGRQPPMTALDATAVPDDTHPQHAATQAGNLLDQTAQRDRQALEIL